MRDTFKKVRNKFLFFNLLITTLILFASFLSVYMMTYHRIQNENRDRLFGEADRIQSSSITQSREVTTNEHEEIVIIEASFGQSISFSLFIDGSGNLSRHFSTINGPRDFYEEAAEMALSQPNQNRIQLAGRYLMYRMMPYDDHGYQIDFLDITDSRATLRNLLVTFSIVGVTSFIAIFFVSLFYANRSIKPISTMWESQRKFVADASHELKTPLSVILANYDVLIANENETVESQKEWLSYIKTSIGRMTELINHLLMLAKTEDSGVAIEKEIFSVSELAHEIADSMEAAARKKCLSFSKEIEPQLSFNGSREMTSQILDILLENAIKYVENKGTITLSLRKKPQQLVLVVENSGEGIPEVHLSKIFDRFYRVDDGRGREEGGFGLGLSIVKALVENLNGEIEVESEIGELTRFTVILNDS